MTEPNSKWVEKLQALMRKAEDPATTEEERNSIVDKVTYLMTKYGIEQDMLAAKEQRPLTAAMRVIRITGTYIDRKVTLLHEICRAFGCMAVTNTDKVRVSVFGTDDDIERVFMLYLSLILQMDTALFTAQALKPKHEHGRTFNSSFTTGFVITVKERIRTAARRAKEDIRKTSEGSGMELVLVNKALLIKKLANEEFPNMSFKSSFMSAHSSTGYGAGSSAGQRADIGGSRISGTHSARRALGN